MKKLFFLSLLILIFSAVLLAQQDDKWQTKKSTHFIVYYKNAPDDFTDHLIESAEEYYDKIADDLGFRRYNFWLWENRAEIYIYDNAREYQDATGQPGWSAGCAVAKKKIIKTFPYAQGFFDTVLPHEMGHIIFREFVGFDNHAVPIWLDEGVACYQGSLRRSLANKLLKETMRHKSFMNLEQLANFKPSSINETEAVNLFYAESLSIVDYLIKKFGSDNFVLFCQNLRDKRDFESAMRSSYPFNTMKEFEQGWQKYLEK